MTIKELLDIDPRMLNEKDLRDLTKQLAKRANRRFRDTSKHFDYETPALKGYKDSGGPIDVRGLNKISRNDLFRPYMRAKNFLTAKTSTVRGAKELKREIEKKIGLGDFKLTPTDEELMWKSFHRLEELRPDLMLGTGYKKVLNELHDRIITNPKSRRSDLIRYIDRVMAREEEKYEEKQKTINDPFKKMGDEEDDGEESVGGWM